MIAIYTSHDSKGLVVLNTDLAPSCTIDECLTTSAWEIAAIVLNLTTGRILTMVSRCSLIVYSRFASIASTYFRSARRPSFVRFDTANCILADMIKIFLFVFFSLFSCEEADVVLTRLFACRFHIQVISIYLLKRYYCGF